ncbi:MAG: DUF5996 family protein [Pyrinomonadaceae bacterium]
MPSSIWPALPIAEWQDTYSTLHRWTQIVGKIRMAQAPLVNHWWNVPLYVSSRGLTTSAIPYEGRTFQIDFDFIDHNLILSCDDGAVRTLPLRPQTVADFYREVMAALADLGIVVKIWTMPVEIPPPIVPFDLDTEHKSYDPEYVNRFWKILVQTDQVFQAFRAKFIGKCSPVHFFWGSFDLAVTRFSGRTAPPREGADSITVEAYSHEVISHGFWPGGGGVEAAYYSYTSPEPAGLSLAKVRPEGAGYSDAMKEFLMPYEVVRTADDPAQALMEFLESTYEAGAHLAKWDRPALERKI